MEQVIPKSSNAAREYIGWIVQVACATRKLNAYSTTHVTQEDMNRYKDIIDNFLKENKELAKRVNIIIV